MNGFISDPKSAISNMYHVTAFNEFWVSLPWVPCKDMKSDNKRNKDSVISAMYMGGKFTFKKNRTWEMSHNIRSLIYIMQKLLSVPEASGSHTKNQSAILGKLQLGIPPVWQRHTVAPPCLRGTIFSLLGKFSSGFILTRSCHINSRANTK